MSTCVILGGAGYIGYRWALRLAEGQRFDRIVLADIREPRGPLPARVEFCPGDVRRLLSSQLGKLRPEWLFNMAAVHREPGHEPHEYFDTNLAGARHACAYAESVNCSNLLFTSSIAVYGRTPGATSETAGLCPQTPYGISKLGAELIHEGWQRAGAERRLLICRPGVIYGPGDPGNILRMIRAVRGGYFVFPGTRERLKSYGYIEGLLDSFEFMMEGSDSCVTFNYAERETESLGQLVQITQNHLGKSIPTLTVPLSLLEAAAALAQMLTCGKSSLHPVRVRKAATSTHIVPSVLLEAGFNFRFDFKRSLEHWSSAAPDDYGPADRPGTRQSPLDERAGAEEATGSAAAQKTRGWKEAA